MGSSMPPKPADHESTDPAKLKEDGKTAFQKLGLDTSTIDWATFLQSGCCGACKQKFGDSDKDWGLLL